MGRHSSNSSKRPVAAVIAPAVAIAGVAVGVYASQSHGSGTAAAGTTSSSGSSAGGSCTEPAHLRVTAPVEISPTVRSLTAGLKASTCLSVDVTDQDAETTARSIAVAAADAPQVWITDSPLWVDRVNQTLKQTPLTAGSSLATSPIGIAVPGAIATTGAVPTGRQSLVSLFTKAGGKLPMRVADPETSSATLLGATGALAATGKDQQASLGLARTMVGLSHSWSTDADLQLAASTDKATLFPASEQQMYALNQQNPQNKVKAISFSDGDPVLDYRIVPVPGSKTADPQQVKAFTDAMSSTDAQAKLAAAGFRTGTSKGPGVDGISGTPVRALPLTIGQVDEAVRVTDAVSLDINMLTVMDVTGSMKDPAIGSLNRAQVATQAVQKAVSLFPTQTRFGLWEFSGGINPKGTEADGSLDYNQLLPIAPLSQKVGAATQQQAVLAALQAMPTHLKGGTPLYDVIRAAYAASQKSYKPGSTSAMVLVTDGKNEDETGLTLDGLMSQLNAMKDPKRPVKVILVGISKDADMPVLRQIAKATGGAAYNASNPADIPNVVFDALAQRVTVATQL